MQDRYALFGHPVAHSRSPGIYARFGLAGFELIDAPPGEFANAVQRFGRQGGRGANVTLPLKLDAAKLADTLSARAKTAGAVNALRFETDGLLFGDNIDGVGLVSDLTRNLGLVLKGKRILVLGAGGAVRGIAQPLLEQSPAELVIANRDAARAQHLAGHFGALGRVRAMPLSAPGKAFDLVINATSASLDGIVPEVPAAVIGAGSVAYDLAYGDDGETAFTRWARAHGAGRCADGWGMLVEQAAESYKLWFGKRPDTAGLLNR